VRHERTHWRLLTARLEAVASILKNLFSEDFCSLLLNKEIVIGISEEFTGPSKVLWRFLTEEKRWIVAIPARDDRFAPNCMFDPSRTNRK